jgi:hypothetical protein
MNMQEIVAQEADNASRVYLHKEGSFWKAYSKEYQNRPK